MNENVKALVDDLVVACIFRSEMGAQIDILHRLVDEADRSVYRSDTAELDTKTIRTIFNWGRCEPVGASHERVDE